MGMPSGIGIVDTMIGFPHKDMKAVYSFITKQTHDRESKEEFQFPAEYMFKQVPNYLPEGADPIEITLQASHDAIRSLSIPAIRTTTDMRRASQSLVDFLFQSLKLN